MKSSKMTVCSEIGLVTGGLPVQIPEGVMGWGAPEQGTRFIGKVQVTVPVPGLCVFTTRVKKMR